MMTESIEGYERVHIDQTLWICPECDGVLDPLGGLRERDEQRNSVDWWDEPERWADVAAVQFECMDTASRV